MNYLAIIAKYLPQVLGLFTVVQQVHAALPANATLGDKVNAVQTVIQAAYTSAQVNNEIPSTSQFGADFAAISPLVNTFVSLLHTTQQTSIAATAAATQQPTVSSSQVSAG